MTIDIAVLGALPLLAGLSPAAISALARRGIVVEFPADGVIFLAGNPPRGWYIVLEGCVRVVRGSGARQHVVHTERAGGTLGEVPLFSGAAHPATAIAAEPTRCALFDKASLELAIAECPEISFVLTRRLALRVERLVERLDERSRSVRSRLADFLLERLESSATGDRVSVGMTQHALAEELGTVREVVSREIRLLAKHGAIESLGGGRYRIVRSDSLRAAARDR